MPSAIPASTHLPIGPAAIDPDAHGRAALLLAESLVHALVENATLTTAEAGAR